MAKLTLHVPDDLVAAAKNEAKSREVSVSKLVSDYFRNFTHKQEDELKELGPLTRSLIGCIPEGTSEDYLDYLEKKHS